jgi:isoleucyl-tRNA synthetase
MSAGADLRASPYPQVSSQPSFPAIEEAVLSHWKEADIFRASVENRPAGARGAGEFVFYDGPPFANGLPHYGHLLTGFVKDVVPRYQTMRGKRVERRFGWDCHGLPAEMEAEKELGIGGRAKILAHGIARFNAHCRTSVQKYTQEWERTVTRQARWVDFANDYKTMDLSYMESVLWAFKRLWEKGLVYESYRVLPYSWAAETPVSNFETRLDNAYRERQDPAITVRFELEPRAGDPGPIALLAWTTTPWTLPSNLALAVGEALEYAVLEKDGRRAILGAAALARYEKELAGWTRAGSVRGDELVGRRYRPLFPFFAERPGAFRVLAGDFVDTAEGSGVVHLAPGFGEDDQRVCAAHGIEVVCPVDHAGRFTAEVVPWQGMNVLEANKPIIAALKGAGVLVKHETIVHNYPHCWRTDTPLIYRALSSWYVKVTALRERMVELNRSIRWVPEHIRDGQFGHWLEGARDWSISRNRFWGSPIPVWRSDDARFPRLDVYGSLAELERDFGVRLADLHRPAVDELVRPNPDDPSGHSRMRRVEDVLDCWFESGSMPFAQAHYPFENQRWFEDHFPADFVVEYVAQTRGWFYTLMVLGTALFDKPPFRNCICHGVVLDEDGQKLSKRLKNYPSPDEVFATHGADALRWFLCSSAILRASDLQIDREGKTIGEGVRLVINPLWQAYSFFTLYANTDGVKAELVSLREDGRSPQGVLDRYVLAKLRTLIEAVTERMDAYDLPGACEAVRDFLDALNNWYIRRSRERFWAAGISPDKRDAYDTLYTVLEHVCRVAAPLLPLVTEEIWRGLTGGKSVHLADWPDARRLPAAGELVGTMDRVREVCSAALGLREERRLRVRLPLASLTLAGPGSERLAPYFDLVRDEINVKAVHTRERIEELGRFELKLNARVLGPRVGSAMKDLLAASKEGRWRRDIDGAVSLAGRDLAADEFELVLKPAAGLDGLALTALPTNDILLALDVRTTPELEREGLARDVVRLVQTARKDAKLHVSDRIRLRIECAGELAEAVRAHHAYLAGETLATSFELGSPDAGMHVARAENLGVPITIALARAT